MRTRWLLPAGLICTLLSGCATIGHRASASLQHARLPGVHIQRFLVSLNRPVGALAVTPRYVFVASPGWHPWWPYRVYQVDASGVTPVVTLPRTGNMQLTDVSVDRHWLVLYVSHTGWHGFPPNGFRLAAMNRSSGQVILVARSKVDDLAAEALSGDFLAVARPASPSSWIIKVINLGEVAVVGTIHLPSIGSCTDFWETAEFAFSWPVLAWATTTRCPVQTVHAINLLTHRRYDLGRARNLIDIATDGRRVVWSEATNATIQGTARTVLVTLPSRTHVIPPKPPATCFGGCWANRYDSLHLPTDVAAWGQGSVILTNDFIIWGGSTPDSSISALDLKTGDGYELQPNTLNFSPDGIAVDGRLVAWVSFLNSGRHRNTWDIELAKLP